MIEKLRDLLKHEDVEYRRQGLELFRDLKNLQGSL